MSNPFGNNFYNPMYTQQTSMNYYFPPNFVLPNQPVS